MNLARKQTKCSYSPTDELIGQQNISENCEITDPKSVADAFNNYFAKIGSNLASSIPSATKTASEFKPPPICDTLFLPLDEIQ